MTSRDQDHAVQRFVAGLPLSPEQEAALSDMVFDGCVDDVAKDFLSSKLCSDSADTRLNAVRLAGQNRDWLPDFILEAVKEIAEKDTDQDVRKLAAKVVDDWAK